MALDLSRFISQFVIATRTLNDSHEQRDFNREVLFVYFSDLSTDRIAPREAQVATKIATIAPQMRIQPPTKTQNPDNRNFKISRTIMPGQNRIT